jgi:hypothetical protein
MKKSLDHNPFLALGGLLLFVYWVAFTPSTISNSQFVAQAEAVIEDVPVEQHLMGEGRMNVKLINSGGECQLDGLKISRSKPVVHWGNAASACPANWWVCTATERGLKYCKDVYASDPTIVDCRLGHKPSLTEEANNTTAWVADINPGISSKNEGMVIDAVNGDIRYSANHCSTRPVWCCTR